MHSMNILYTKLFTHPLFYRLKGSQNNAPALQLFLKYDRKVNYILVSYTVGVEQVVKPLSTAPPLMLLHFRLSSTVMVSFLRSNILFFLFFFMSIDLIR